MRNIAIVPARSGSKGLRDKNIKLLCGKPLMAYTIEAALKSGKFDCVHVSTDSAQYADIAREYGADVPFLRDEIFATDGAGTWDTLRFAVKRYRELGQEFDTVTLLQPTSPLRGAEEIREAFAVFDRKQAESVVSICELEHSIDICNILGEDGSMQDFIDIHEVGRRQDSPVYYRLNGAIYIQKTEILMEGRSLYGEQSYAYTMDEAHSIDIDNALDFYVAEAVMTKIKSGILSAGL